MAYNITVERVSCANVIGDTPLDDSNGLMRITESLPLFDQALDASTPKSQIKNRFQDFVVCVVRFQTTIELEMNAVK